MTVSKKLTSEKGVSVATKRACCPADEQFFLDAWAVRVPDDGRPIHERRAERTWSNPIEKAGFFIASFGPVDGRSKASEALCGAMGGRPGTHRLLWDEQVLALLEAAADPDRQTVVVVWDDDDTEEARMPLSNREAAKRELDDALRAAGISVSVLTVLWADERIPADFHQYVREEAHPKHPDELVETGAWLTDGTWTPLFDNLSDAPIMRGIIENATYAIKVVERCRGRSAEYREVAWLVVWPDREKYDVAAIIEIVKHYARFSLLSRLQSS